MTGIDAHPPARMGRTESSRSGSTSAPGAGDSAGSPEGGGGGAGGRIDFIGACSAAESASVPSRRVTFMTGITRN